MQFVQKKLSQKMGMLPEIIFSERQKAKLAIEELSIKTGIALKYLEALEKGYYHLLPGEVYARQFIKKLAEVFHLNEKRLIGLWHKEKSVQLPLLPNSKQKSSALTNIWLTPVLIKKSALALILLALFGYLAWEIKNIFTPPELIILSPFSQTITLENSVEIKGQTEPESRLLINQQPILLETNGYFSQIVDLTIGLNIFTIASSKAHSKPSVQTISVLRQINANQ